MVGRVEGRKGRLGSVDKLCGLIIVSGFPLYMVFQSGLFRSGVSECFL